MRLGAWLGLAILAAACGGATGVDEPGQLVVGRDAEAERDAAADRGPVDPCQGKACGERCDCSLGGDCTHGARVGRCTDEGVCTNALSFCRECTVDADCPPPPPGCSVCPDGRPWCPTVKCELERCVTPPPECGPSRGYEPCAGQACGFACVLCDPRDTRCVEPPGDRRCTDIGGDCILLGGIACPP